MTDSAARLPAADIIARVFAEIDRRADDLVRLTSDLIRFETVNPPGRDYEPCADGASRATAMIFLAPT